MSQEVKVIDKDGEWYVNTAQYRFVHGTRQGVIFEPGVATKFKSQTKAADKDHPAVADWIDGQPLIQKIADPYGELPKQVKSETPLKDQTKK